MAAARSDGPIPVGSRATSHTGTDPTRVTESPAETERAGAELAAELSAGDVVLVSGELGSGKTTFVRGALRALGVTEPVRSPTFVVGVSYSGTRARAAHIDLYRLAGLDGEDPGLLDPYFGPDTVTFVEWPERAADEELIGGRAVARRVALAHAGGDRRRIVVRR